MTIPADNLGAESNATSVNFNFASLRTERANYFSPTATSWVLKRPTTKRGLKGQLKIV
jgi:hypothetical protein